MTIRRRILSVNQIKEGLKDKKIYVVARVTGLSYPTIKMIADGKRSNPTFDTLKKLSDYLMINSQWDKNIKVNKREMIDALRDTKQNKKSVDTGLDEDNSSDEPEYDEDEDYIEDDESEDDL